MTQEQYIAANHLADHCSSSWGFQVLAVQKEAELVRLTAELEDLKRRHTQLQSKSSSLENMTKHNAEQFSQQVL